MVEKTQRARVGDQPRAETGIEWDVFVREDTGDPLRHVGSITAPSVEVAYEQATKLFAWYADDLWLCRSQDLHRFSTHGLDEDAEPIQVDTGSEPRSHE